MVRGARASPVLAATGDAMTARRLPLLALAVLTVACTAAPQPACEETAFEDVPLVVCRFDPQAVDMRLVLAGPDGDPYRQFEALAGAVAAGGGTLEFAMNAGMYHSDRSPVGLYVEDGDELAPLSRRDGPGNFHMLPNGVFYLLEDGTAGVLASDAYAEAGLAPRFATQSGPMLVIDGALHPAFNPEGTSRRRRNGVGVTEDGTVVFALSDFPVTFHTFARAFRDGLGTPDALYLDGVVSRVWAPALGRAEKGLDLGPMVAVIAQPH